MSREKVDDPAIWGGILLQRFQINDHRLHSCKDVDDDDDDGVNDGDDKNDDRWEKSRLSSEGGNDCLDNDCKNRWTDSVDRSARQLTSVHPSSFPSFFESAMATCLSTAAFSSSTYSPSSTVYKSMPSLNFSPCKPSFHFGSFMSLFRFTILAFTALDLLILLYHCHHNTRLFITFAL